MLDLLLLIVMVYVSKQAGSVLGFYHVVPLIFMTLL